MIISPLGKKTHPFTYGNNGSLVEPVPFSDAKVLLFCEINK